MGGGGLRAEDQAKQAKMHNICRNGLQLAILVRSDPDVRSRQVILALVGGPLADWHTSASCDLRSADGASDRVPQQCTGLIFCCTRRGSL